MPIYGQTIAFTRASHGGGARKTGVLRAGAQQENRFLS
jgi:hypothetical protein